MARAEGATLTVLVYTSPHQGGRHSWCRQLTLSSCPLWRVGSPATSWQCWRLCMEHCSQLSLSALFWILSNVSRCVKAALPQVQQYYSKEVELDSAVQLAPLIKELQNFPERGQLPCHCSGELLSVNPKSHLKCQTSHSGSIFFLRCHSCLSESEPDITSWPAHHQQLGFVRGKMGCLPSVTIVEWPQIYTCQQCLQGLMFCKEFPEGQSVRHE